MVLTGVSGRATVQNAPRNRRYMAYNRAAGLKVLLFAVALGTLLASSAFPQVLEGTILLPDSLGPLTGKNHVAFDEDSARPRIFIGGEGGDVIVANAVTCERFARIRSGPMNALCYVPTHNKLYVSTTDECGVAVVDCNTYEVIKRLPFPSLVTGLYYNQRVDRVYCAGDPLKVVDCTSDSVVDSLMMNATNAHCVLDDFRNKLYVSAEDSLRVVDCSRDSVVARLFGPRGAQAICYQPSAGKVYVAAGESLFALNTKSDAVVYRQGFDTLYAQLACDPVHNRVYYTYWSHLIALDCDSDSILWNYDLWGRALSLAPVPELNKLYVMLIALGSTFKYVLDGSTGQELRHFPLTNEGSLYHSPSTNRVFATQQENVVTAIDARGDTLAGVVPLGAPVSSMIVDTADNKLYFISQYQQHMSRVGIVDCSTNKVKSYSRALGWSHGLAHNSRDAKLYCSADSSIFVFDCRADTLVKEIPIDGIPCDLVWYPNLNKLYAVTIFRDSTLFMNVVDCSRDTVGKVLGLALTSSVMLLTSESDLLWIFGSPRYRVIDCLSDSIVEDTADGGGESVSYSPAERKVYATLVDGLYVIDVDSRLPIDTLPLRTAGWSRQVYCAERARKAYWTIQHGQDRDTVIAVDMRLDSIVSRFTVPLLSYGVCEDRTGDYVYFASDYLVAVDTRTDSIVSGVHLSLQTEYLVRNRATNYLYIAGLDDSIIQVVYDSVIFAGLQAQPGHTIQAEHLRTLLGRNVPLRCATEGVLFDPSGRKAAVLKTGLNDIGHLAPGVYLMREAHAQAVRKVVVTR
jgi:DNA-binding beta-propeller fold protein YncE